MTEVKILKVLILKAAQGIFEMLKLRGIGKKNCCHRQRNIQGKYLDASNCPVLKIVFLFSYILEKLGELLLSRLKFI